MLGINGLRRLLKFTYGSGLILVGVDKFFGFLTEWTQYLSPIITETIGIDAAAFMGLIGVIEIGVGVLILTKWSRTAAYIASAFTILIAVNLLTTGQYLDIAVRDILIAVGVFVLGELSGLESTLPDKISDRPTDETLN